MHLIFTFRKQDYKYAIKHIANFNVDKSSRSEKI